MNEKLDLAKSLEDSMWQCALNCDSEGFLEIVSEKAVMICGGYRCLGNEYSQFIKEGITSSYEFLAFEIIYEDENIIQVHYVIDVKPKDKNQADCAGKFHVTSTWKKINDKYMLIFNMDSKIFE